MELTNSLRSPSIEKKNNWNPRHTDCLIVGIPVNKNWKPRHRNEWDAWKPRHSKIFRWNPRQNHWKPRRQKLETPSS